MKKHRYWLDTSCHRILHFRMRQMDFNLIIYRSGKALGIINDRR